MTKTEMQTTAASTSESRGKKKLFIATVFTIVLTAAYFASRDQILLPIAGVLALGAIYFMFKRPEFATLAFAFILYGNFAVVAVQFHHVPSIAAAGVSGLLVLPLAYFLIERRERLIVNTGLGLILIYLLALVASALFAYNMELALNEIGNFFVEGLLLYFLLINVIRELPTLKRVIWTLLLVGGILGGLSLFQEVTRTYEYSYGGLAQKNEDLDVGEVNFDEYGGSRRAGGPFGKENRYAQMMVVIFPMALGMFFIAPTRKLKFFSLAAAGLILGGIVLTFSRGAFVTIAGMLLITVFLRYIRPLHALAGVAVLVTVVIVALPEYVERVSSVGNLSSLAAGNSEGAREADGSLRGRFAENLAAVRVFSEYPILGVGSGHYAKFYSAKYGNEVGIKRLISNRRAHSLYLEILADNGLVGLLTFMAIALVTCHQLWRLRRRLNQTRPALAHLATAFLLGIFGYFGTATFLHLAYQRYYWFLMALAGATIRILDLELAASPSHENHFIDDERFAESENIPHKQPIAHKSTK